MGLYVILHLYLETVQIVGYKVRLANNSIKEGFIKNRVALWYDIHEHTRLLVDLLLGKPQPEL